MPKPLLLIISLFIFLPGAAQHRWTLQECIDYAHSHNITLQKLNCQQATYDTQLSEARAAWLPSMSAALNEGATWRPFQESTVNFVNGGMAATAAKKTTESGSYGLNAGWTLYNGGQRKLNIQSATLQQQRGLLSVEEQKNALTEQIAQLYVQILYMQEALRVNEEVVHQDSLIWQRGVQFMECGKLARASVQELEATLASGRYDLVNTRTQIAQAQLQLAQLLELPAGETIEILSTPTDTEVLQALPDQQSVYAEALRTRPEIKGAELATQQSRLATRIARAARIPTVSLNAGINDSHMTGAATSAGKQLRSNLNAVAGVAINIPLLDQRRTRSSIERAQIGELNAQLDLADAQKELYQRIAQYWLTAHNSQQKYQASQSNVQSRTASHELLQEQFNVGLKNISDLLQSRAALLISQQTLLQDKYNALLHRSLLNFYTGSPLKL